MNNHKYKLSNLRAYTIVRYNPTCKNAFNLFICLCMCLYIIIYSASAGVGICLANLAKDQIFL